jgi:hypothetical protein
MSKSVKEIIKEYLAQNGYDGLYNDHCGCALEWGIMNCDKLYSDCRAGYKKYDEKSEMDFITGEK